MDIQQNISDEKLTYQAFSVQYEEHKEAFMNVYRLACQILTGEDIAEYHKYFYKIFGGLWSKSNSKNKTDYVKNFERFNCSVPTALLSHDVYVKITDEGTVEATPKDGRKPFWVLNYKGATYTADKLVKMFTEGGGIVTPETADSIGYVCDTYFCNVMKGLNIYHGVKTYHIFWRGKGGTGTMKTIPGKSEWEGFGQCRNIPNWIASSTRNNNTPVGQKAKNIRNDKILGKREYSTVEKDILALERTAPGIANMLRTENNPNTTVEEFFDRCILASASEKNAITARMMPTPHPVFSMMPFNEAMVHINTDIEKRGMKATYEHLAAFGVLDCDLGVIMQICPNIINTFECQEIAWNEDNPNHFVKGAPILGVLCGVESGGTDRRNHGQKWGHWFQNIPGQTLKNLELVRSSYMPRGAMTEEKKKEILQAADYDISGIFMGTDITKQGTVADVKVILEGKFLMSLSDAQNTKRKKNASKMKERAEARVAKNEARKKTINAGTMAKAMSAGFVWRDNGRKISINKFVIRLANMHDKGMIDEFMVFNKDGEAQIKAFLSNPESCGISEGEATIVKGLFPEAAVQKLLGTVGWGTVATNMEQEDVVWGGKTPPINICDEPIWPEGIAYGGAGLSSSAYYFLPRSLMVNAVVYKMNPIQLTQGVAAFNWKVETLIKAGCQMITGAPGDKVSTAASSFALQEGGVGISFSGNSNGRLKFVIAQLIFGVQHIQGLREDDVTTVGVEVDRIIAGKGTAFNDLPPKLLLLYNKYLGNDTTEQAQPQA